MSLTSFAMKFLCKRVKNDRCNTELEYKIVNIKKCVTISSQEYRYTNSTVYVEYFSRNTGRCTRYNFSLCIILHKTRADSGSLQYHDQSFCYR